MYLPWCYQCYHPALLTDENILRFNKKSQSKSRCKYLENVYLCFGEYIQYLMDIKIGMWLVAGPGYLHTATTDAADAAPQGGAGDCSTGSGGPS